MQILIRAALAAFSIATITPVANAASLGNSQAAYHHAYDNTGRGPQQTGLEGGGG